MRHGRLQANLRVIFGVVLFLVLASATYGWTTNDTAAAFQAASAASAFIPSPWQPVALAGLQLLSFLIGAFTHGRGVSVGQNTSTNKP